MASVAFCAVFCRKAWCRSVKRRSIAATRGASSSQARPAVASASGVAASWISSGTTNSPHRMLGRPNQGCKAKRFMRHQLSHATW